MISLCAPPVLSRGLVEEWGGERGGHLGGCLSSTSVSAFCSHLFSGSKWWVLMCRYYQGLLLSLKQQAVEKGRKFSLRQPIIWVL